MTPATEFPPFPLGHSSTISWMCNKIFLVLKVNYSLVLISFYYSWYTSSSSPFLPFLSSEVLSLSHLLSQLQLQKLNVFSDCRSLFKSEETAVTCRYSQYFVALRNKMISKAEGNIPDRRKSQTHTSLNLIHSRWHILPLVYLPLAKFIFSCMQIGCQLSALSKFQH